jgi:hypothetical protein
LAAGRFGPADTSGNHARVIEHKHVAGAKKRWQIQKFQIVHGTRASDVQQSATTAQRCGALRNQLFGQVVVEVGAPHRARKAIRQRPRSLSDRAARDDSQEDSRSGAAAQRELTGRLVRPSTAHTIDKLGFSTRI